MILFNWFLVSSDIQLLQHIYFLSITFMYKTYLYICKVLKKLFQIIMHSETSFNIYYIIYVQHVNTFFDQSSWIIFFSTGTIGRLPIPQFVAKLVHFMTCGLDFCFMW